MPFSNIVDWRQGASSPTWSAQFDEARACQRLDDELEKVQLSKENEKEKKRKRKPHSSFDVRRSSLEEKKLNLLLNHLSPKKNNTTARLEPPPPRPVPREDPPPPSAPLVLQVRSGKGIPGPRLEKREEPARQGAARRPAARVAAGAVRRGPAAGALGGRGPCRLRRGGGAGLEREDEGEEQEAPSGRSGD